MTARQELIHRTARRAAAYLVEVGVTGHRAQIEDEVIRQLVAKLGR